jgi:hypothetical protein
MEFQLRSIEEIPIEIGDFVLIDNKYYYVRSCSGKIECGTFFTGKRTVVRLPADTLVLKGAELSKLPSFEKHFTDFHEDFPFATDCTKLITGLFYRQDKKRLRYCPDTRTRGKEVFHLLPVKMVREGDIVYFEGNFFVSGVQSIVSKEKLIIRREDLPYDFYRRKGSDLQYVFDEEKLTLTQIKKPYLLRTSLDVVIGDFVYNEYAGVQLVTQVRKESIVCKGPSEISAFIKYEDQCYPIPPSMVRGKPFSLDDDSWNYQDWSEQYFTLSFPFVTIHSHMIE